MPIMDSCRTISLLQSLFALSVKLTISEHLLCARAHACTFVVDTACNTSARLPRIARTFRALHTYFITDDSNRDIQIHTPRYGFDVFGDGLSRQPNHESKPYPLTLSGHRRHDSVPDRNTEIKGTNGYC